MARPSKLTPKIQELLLEAISSGLTYDSAAKLAGIDRTTFYRWKRKAKSATSGLFLQFCHALKRAEVFGEAVLLKIINDAAEGGQPIVTTCVTYDADGKVIKSVTHETKTLPDWKASAWWLERRFPAEWGRRYRSLNSVDEKDALDRWIEDLKAAEDRKP
jgi:hypothetical protein